MSKRNAASSPSSNKTTIVEQPGPDGRVVQVPTSEWKAPKKIGTLESWYIFYEGMFAGSMLETVSASRLASPQDSYPDAHFFF
jgi:hypothetical protein